MSGHGTLVPFPNGWRVFWRGQDWGTISRASARDDIRLRRTIFRPGGLNDIREPGLANGGARNFSPVSQWVAGVLAGAGLGNDIPGFRPGRYPAAPDDIQAWRPERYSRAGARERRGHGILVPFPNWWRVFWRGRNWERYPGLPPGTISGCAGRYSGLAA